jgi:excisionase family DNA binding protein
VLTPEQARRVLGIGRNTMYEAIRTGQVAAVRFGRRLVIPREQLRRLLSGG